MSERTKRTRKQPGRPAPFSVFASPSRGVRARPRRKGNVRLRGRNRRGPGSAVLRLNLLRHENQSAFQLVPAEEVVRMNVGAGSGGFLQWRPAGTSVGSCRSDRESVLPFGDGMHTLTARRQSPSGLPACAFARRQASGPCDRNTALPACSRQAILPRIQGLESVTRRVFGHNDSTSPAERLFQRTVGPECSRRESRHGEICRGIQHRVAGGPE